MWVPLCAAWLATVSLEELSHYSNFIGPPKPQGWRVWGHEANEQRIKGEMEAKSIRDTAQMTLIRRVIDEHREVLTALKDR